MPVESWSAKGTNYGWSCVEPGCFASSTVAVNSQEEAVQDLEDHCRKEHGAY